MSETGFITLAAIAGVIVVALVVVLAIVAVARKETKNIHIGDEYQSTTIDNSTKINGIPVTPATVPKPTASVGHGVKQHFYAFTFVPPPLAIIGMFLIIIESRFAIVGEVLLWSAATLLVPAIYGELARPASITSRIVLVLDVVLLAFLVMAIAAAPFPSVEVLVGTSLATISFAIAARGHKVAS